MNEFWASDATRWRHYGEQWNVQVFQGLHQGLSSRFQSRNNFIFFKKKMLVLCPCDLIKGFKLFYKAVIFNSIKLMTAKLKLGLYLNLIKTGRINVTWNHEIDPSEIALHSSTAIES